jgi:hypothetical protein
MCSNLDYFTGYYHRNPVGALHCTQPMGNNDAGATGH